MAVNASKKAISLLDALDQSFASSSSPAFALPSDQAQGTPVKLNPLQTPNLNDFFEAKSSSSSKAKTLDDLRAAQKLHDSRRSNAGKFGSPSAACVMSNQSFIL